MDIFRYIFEEFRFVGELLSAGLILTLPSIRRRKRFVFKGIFGALFCFAFSVFYVLIWQAVKGSEISYLWLTVIHVSWYFLLVIFFATYLSICFCLNMSEVLWIVILSYAMQHIEFVAVNEILFMGIAPEFNNNYYFAYIAICIASCAALYYIFYKMFVPNIISRERLPLNDSLKQRISYLALLIFFYGITFVNQFLTVHYVEKQFNYLAAVTDFFNCLVVLIVQYSSLRAARLFLEKTDAVRLYKDSVNRYEKFKETVQYLNVKCHDIKHEMRRIQQQKDAVSADIDALNERIALYESYADTGNTTLDMVLNDWFLLCRNSKIAFSYMAEAERLSSMAESDIYVLFSNILDNAVEHMKLIKDERKRYINLSVKPAKNMLHIQIENYLEGELKFADGLPQTTKENKIYHGFGLISIRGIVKKYGGEFRVDAADNIFKVDILLPDLKRRKKNMLNSGRRF